MGHAQIMHLMKCFE